MLNRDSTKVFKGKTFITPYHDIGHNDFGVKQYL